MRFFKLLKTIRLIHRKGFSSDSEVGLSICVNKKNRLVYDKITNDDITFKTISWTEVLLKLKFINTVILVGISIGKPKVKKVSKNTATEFIDFSDDESEVKND